MEIVDVPCLTNLLLPHDGIVTEPANYTKLSKKITRRGR
jgi:hypothetical protein